MKLLVGELRYIIGRALDEAVGDRGYPGDKAHLICYVLSQAGGPMERPAVMQKVEAIEGKDPERFSSKTNNCYWSPATMKTGDWVQDPARPDDQWARVRTNTREVPNTCAGEAAKQSVLRRGLVQLAGKRGNALLYTLTPEGQKFADETVSWLQENPDAMGNIAPKPAWMGDHEDV